MEYLQLKFMVWVIDSIILVLELYVMKPVTINDWNGLGEAIEDRKTRGDQLVNEIQQELSNKFGRLL